MPLSGIYDTIRVKNITEHTTVNYNNIVFYDASKTYLKGTTISVANSSVTVSDGVYSTEPKNFTSGAVAFFRFSCGSITNETIVTVNEEIV